MASHAVCYGKEISCMGDEGMIRCGFRVDFEDKEAVLISAALKSLVSLPA